MKLKFYQFELKELWNFAILYCTKAGYLYSSEFMFASLIQ